VKRLSLAIVVGGLSGFIALSYEIIWYRAIGFASGGTASAFGFLLAFYLYGLATGALIVKRLASRPGSSKGQATLLWLAGFVVAANLFGFLVAPALAMAAIHGHWNVALPLIALAASLLGAIFPLACHYGIPPDARVGARLSYVYFANICGSALGSGLTGYVLLQHLPLAKLAVLLLQLGVCLGWVLLALTGPNLSTLGLTFGVAVAGLALSQWRAGAALDHFYEKLLLKERFTPGFTFARTLENRVGVINVTADRTVFGGGAYDGAVSTDLLNDRNGIVRAYAVGGLHSRPREVLMIGLSMGAWAQVIAQLPGVDHLTVVEINPGYLELIAAYPQVASLLRNPRVSIAIDDGRRWLARHPGRQFDVVVANVSFNWRANVTNLLSAEFLSLVREHLRPGGVYYYNTTGSLEAFKTAFSTFPYGLRFFNFVAVSDSPVRLDRQRWATVLSGLRIDEQTVLGSGDGIREDRLAAILQLAEPAAAPPDSASLETKDQMLDRLRGSRTITDDNMGTEWDAPFPGVWIPPTLR